MKRWQIGYRLLSEIEAQGKLGIRHPGSPGHLGNLQDLRFTTPYHDLPEFEAQPWEATLLVGTLQMHFPSGEWRLAECK